jgi:hypothetical protein
MQHLLLSLEENGDLSRLWKYITGCRKQNAKSFFFFFCEREMTGMQNVNGFINRFVYRLEILTLLDKALK